MDRIVIFGAGDYGICAKVIYEKKCTIHCFVDNDLLKWGTTIGDIPVFGPDVLNSLDKNTTIVIAARPEKAKEIRRQVVEKYNYSKILIFNISYSENPQYWAKEIKNIEGDDIVISFMGGLGNQMFQYAMLKYLESIGRNVSADFSWYILPGQTFHETMIWDVFPNIHIPHCHPDKVSKYRQMEDVYEELLSEHGSVGLIKRISECKKGIWKGYFQVFDMVNGVSDCLKRDFCFDANNELELIKNKIKEKKTVSVHIRRCDYLNDENDSLNVCDKNYYQTAMRIMEEKIGDVEWVFFSDDIAWVKETFQMDNSQYIQDVDFVQYENWYDMYLMSQCNHHIIANSSFSWWAAWMNDELDKIVIAPKTWSKRCCFPDVCPENWIIV